MKTSWGGLVSSTNGIGFNEDVLFLCIKRKWVGTAKVGPVSSLKSSTMQSTALRKSVSATSKSTMNFGKNSEDSRLALPQMRYLLPRIFSRTFKKTGINGASILSNAMFSESRMQGMNPLSINKDNPFFGDPPGLTEKPDLVEKIRSLVQLQGCFQRLN